MSLRKHLGKAVPIAGMMATAIPSPAAGCVLADEEPLPVSNLKKQCREAWRDREQILDDLRTGKASFIEHKAMAEVLGEGDYECEQREEFAFALADAALGSPVRKAAVDAGAAEVFRRFAPADLPEQCAAEVSYASWILARGSVPPCGLDYYDFVPRRLSENDDFIWFLMSPPYWEQALEMLGNNPPRDRLVLHQLIDPASPGFDLKTAARLAPNFTQSDYDGVRRAVIIDVAEAVANPQFGTPDYEAAAKLLDWYSPYGREKLTPDEQARIRNLWVRIAQTRLTSDNAALRRSANDLFRASSPFSQEGTPLSEVLPDGSEVIFLTEWPDALPKIRNFGRTVGRFQTAYPGRAVRYGEEGRVEYGVVFGPDGNFHSLHVERSAGDNLDAGTLRNARRIFRPRLSEMHLPGYQGSYVYVPLPPVEYRLFNRIEDPSVGHRPLVEGTIRIYYYSPNRD